MIVAKKSYILIKTVLEYHQCKKLPRSFLRTTKVFGLRFANFDFSLLPCVCKISENLRRMQIKLNTEVYNDSYLYFMVS